MTINREVARIASRTNKIDRNHVYPLLINGDMKVAQRGTTSTDVGANNEYETVDRWRHNFALTDGRLTSSQSTDVPDGQGFKHSLKLDCTTADTSIGTSEWGQIYQGIEGQNLALVNKGTVDCSTFTVVFWAKGTAKTYICELYDAPNNRRVAKTFTVSTSWTKHVINFPADTSTDDDFTYTNADGLHVQFQIHAGTNYTSGTLDETWTDVSAADRYVGVESFFSSTDNELYLTGVQLELGTFAEGSEPEFQFVDYATQLKQCQRYFQVIANGDDQFMGNGHYHADDRIFFPAHFKNTMRATPTIQVTTASGYWAVEGGNSTGTFDNIDSVAHGTPKGALFNVEGDGLNAPDPYTGNSTFKVRSNNAAARLYLESEL